MGTLNVFFLLVIFLFTTNGAAEHCLVSKCGLLPVRFPFVLEGKQPPSCGYPGFNLTCNEQRPAALKLPNAGKIFYVREIVYALQVLTLYDPNDCLPRRLQDFYLSGSPFKALFYRNYTLLSCPTTLVESKYNTIKCMDNSTHSFLATSNLTLAKTMLPSCKIMDTYRVPVSGEDDLQRNDYTTELNRDIQLVWDEPDCEHCEAEGGVCGYKNETTRELNCFSDAHPGGNSGGLLVFRIIVLSIAAPAVLCATGIAIFVCLTDRRRNNTQQIGTAASQQQSTVEERGLDEATIESYKKIVIGESKRLPGHNDNTCAICLSEYDSKETLRCIPECEHCFHVECIDEWLRTHISCPVCRNSPSPINV